jgi:hypothetical protein
MLELDLFYWKPNLVLDNFFLGNLSIPLNLKQIVPNGGFHCSGGVFVVNLHIHLAYAPFIQDCCFPCIQK